MATVSERFLPENELATDGRPGLPETMRAVVLTGPNKHEIRDDVPVPAPRAAGGPEQGRFGGHLRHRPAHLRRPVQAAGPGATRSSPATNGQARSSRSALARPSLAGASASAWPAPRTPGAAIAACVARVGTTCAKTTAASRCTTSTATTARAPTPSTWCTRSSRCFRCRTRSSSSTARCSTPPASRCTRSSGRHRARRRRRRRRRRPDGFSDRRLRARAGRRSSDPDWLG